MARHEQVHTGEAMRLSALMTVTGISKKRNVWIWHEGLCQSWKLWEITRPKHHEYESWLKNPDRTDWKMKVEKRKFDSN